MKKYITFVIPCYNSASYMTKCIESCLISDEVEILIIDDGSTKDNTLGIAKSYEEKYPNICRCIHKENGGHGSVVNRGIEEASGLYIKIVDSDDWLDKQVLIEIFENIKKFVNNYEKRINREIDRFFDNNKYYLPIDDENDIPDLIITDFIYDKVDTSHKKIMNYIDALEEMKMISWDEVGRFSTSEYLLMHSLMYKTKVLRDCNLRLPEHTFYVDNIYAYKPLPYVKTLIYFHKTLYHYYIGREDQSVNEEVMIGRLEQQYRVTYYMLKEVDIWSIKSKRLQDYMINYMNIIMTVSSILSLKSKDEKWIKERDKLWEYVKNKDRDLYNKLYYTFLGIGSTRKDVVGKYLALLTYKFCKRAIGFN